jgi:hypothetical protein
MKGANILSHVSINLDPTHEFKNELLKIQNTFYLDIAVEALNKVPNYFWFVPASASGKYHPKSSLGMGGLVRHVKSVFWIAEELLAHPLYAPFNEDEKDEIRVAVLLHDACKQGIENEGTSTLAEHPLLVRDHLMPDAIPMGRTTDVWSTDDIKLAGAWFRICDLIETHMGIWTKDKQGNEILDVPKTKAQLFVHMCDFLASRKIIEVDVTARDEQNGYANRPDKDAWKNDPVTEGQINYIKKLYVMVSEKGLYYPPIEITDTNGKIIFTKGLATDTIDAMKQLLGIK